MTLMPDDSVVVTDFIWGWNWLKNLDEATLKQIEAEYSEQVDRIKADQPDDAWKAQDTKGDPFLEVLQALIRGDQENSSVVFTEQWISTLQSKIDFEGFLGLFW